MDDAARKAVDERIGQALQEVYDLARGEHRGGKAWCMRVPVHPDDSDIVLAEALRHARAMIETLAAAIREVEVERDKWQALYSASFHREVQLERRQARVEAALRDANEIACSRTDDELEQWQTRHGTTLDALTPDSTTEGNDG